MIGIVAQLRQRHGLAAARAVVALVVLGLLASGLAGPYASAAGHGLAVASELSDCPTLGGPGAGHDMPVDAHGGHQSGGGDTPASGDGCGPTACCPADLAVGFEATRRPHAPEPRTFGVDAPPPAAPGDERDRPPRLS